MNATDQIMIFDDVDGQPIPRLAKNASGEERPVDGVKTFSLEQAANHFGKSESELQSLWRNTWSDLLSPASVDETGHAATSIDADSSAPQVDLSMRIRLAALKRMMFGHLSEELFSAFIEQCRIRNLDPWSKQVYPKVQPNRNNPRELEVVLIVSIEGLRLQADRSGLYCGNDAAQFEFDDRNRLTKASVTVWKLVGADRRPFTAEVYWDEYRPLDESETSLWDRMPRVCLGKCAEAAAIRKAFPKETGGLYTPEEMEQAYASQRIEGQQAIDRPARPAVFSGGMTYDAFCSEMGKLGHRGTSLTKVMSEYRQKFPLLADSNTRGFWNAILEDLRKKQTAVA